MKSRVKPRLLMVSHRLPNPRGDGADARCWQLLRLAGITHEVDLASAAMTPVSLAQWRTALSQTHRLMIDRPALASRLVAKALRRLKPGAGERWELAAALAGPLGQWTRQHEYDAVLCTHPALWPVARQVAARLRVCDADPASKMLDASCVRECDVLTSSRETTPALGQAMFLPQAVDLDYFNADSSPGPEPRLMLHVDAQCKPGRAAAAWFARQVWAKVKQAVPEAQGVIGQASPAQELDALSQASVIVSPMEDPATGRWPVLQAMAMRRPVIAPGKAVEQLGVRHGEHLLLSHRPADWVELCVESLRCASVRLKLASAGRAFVEQHGQLHRTGGPLLAKLAGEQVAHRPIPPSPVTLAMAA